MIGTNARTLMTPSIAWKTILRKHFVTDDKTEGYRKDGSVAVAQFEIEGDDAEAREQRTLRQRVASDVVMRFVEAVG
ncbi:hypothetical protein [Bradyrhizobium forestalis]|uniref:hypothetical protein n=1 Tax=Bradyrhizobium forestalis TaxID=1419263 RepID=UPI001FE14130|nr:hypothetical protein [Bradyrhizobium forestalis]